MKQTAFACLSYDAKKRQTRRERFLLEKAGRLSGMQQDAGQKHDENQIGKTQADTLAKELNTGTDKRRHDQGGQMAALFTSGPASSGTARQARQIDLQHRQKWRCWPPFQGVPGAPRKSLNVLARASPSCVSHSHITSTSHPAAASCASAALSRSMLRSSLGSQ